MTTAPDEQVAERLAETLIQESLAGCIQILPQGRSIYRWEGAIHKDAEWVLLIKTTRGVYARLESRLKTLHPYDTPELLALEVTEGHPAYLAWLNTTVS
ncbi:MAG: divalent-cation tolerance protein CutA [Magnetococcales bacterium]|nr:divalent-cation tolerance protein CutA [Magnetococcales bacterium]